MAADKLAILRKLTTILEATPGYDLEGKVFRGRRFVAAEDIGDVAMSIMEAPRAVIGNSAGENGFYRNPDWTLNIQGWPLDDRVHPSDPAYTMAAAVETQLKRTIAVSRAHAGSGAPGQPLYPDDYMLSGTWGIKDITLANSIVMPAQENLSRFAFFYIPVVISIIN